MFRPLGYLFIGTDFRFFIINFQISYLKLTYIKTQFFLQNNLLL